MIAYAQRQYNGKRRGGGDNAFITEFYESSCQRMGLVREMTGERTVLSAKRPGLSANRPVNLEKIGKKSSRMLRTAERKIKYFGDAVKRSGSGWRKHCCDRKIEKKIESQEP